MRLSKQERIATIVILIIVLLGVGAFLIVKPAFESLSATMTNLDNKKAEHSAAVEKRARKAGLRDQILAAYEEGEHMADMFFPELKNYEADISAREFLSQVKANVLVEELTVGAPKTATLSTNFYVPDQVTYNLKTYATQGAELPEDQQRLQDHYAEILAALGENQTIGASEVEMKVLAIDREELLKFADEVNKYIKNENGASTRKAVLLSGIVLTYEDIEDKYKALCDEIEEEATAAGKIAIAEELGVTVEGAENTTNPANPVEGGEGGDQQGEGEQKIERVTDYIYGMEITLTFFSIERMQDPTAQLDEQDGKAA